MLTTTIHLLIYVELLKKLRLFSGNNLKNHKFTFSPKLHSFHVVSVKFTFTHNIKVSVLLLLINQQISLLQYETTSM